MADDRTDRQGARDAATVLPFIAAMLFLPPLILIFGTPVLVAGVPLILVYLFGAWALVIAIAFVLARRLGDGGAPDGAGRQDGDGSPPAAGGAQQLPPDRRTPL